MGFFVRDVNAVKGASARRARLDQLLVARGYCSHMKEAQALIMAGQVLVNEVRLDKPGTPVLTDAGIRIKGRDIPYVGRGGLKLQAALDRWGIRTEGRVALDAGASTGGFTDCLLKRGCALVYAVDVGYGQLAGSLRQDPRVRNMERTNISDVRPESLDPPPSLGVMDLSYLSLSVAVPVVAGLLVQDDPDREIVALVKPLFEVPASGPDLSREQYEAALRRACRAGTEAGMRPSAAMASPVLGSSGTLEFLVLFRPLQERMQAGSEQDPEREPGFGFPIDDMIAEALDEGEAVLKGDDRRSDLL